MFDITSLLSTATIIFCLSIAAITYVINLIVQYILTKYNKTINIYKDIILPLMPIAIGLLLSIPNMGYTPDFVNNLYSRLLFGIVCGLISNTVYRIIKAALNNIVNSPTKPPTV